MTKISFNDPLAATGPLGCETAFQARLPGVGDRVLGGKYRIDEVLGVGGMGVVVAAEHVALGRPVALKFLAPGRSACAARFVREARVAARVESDYVAHVSDVGVLESDAVYMVMERLYGEDAGAYVRRVGPLPIDEAVLYIVQACDAIAAAHAAGIIHRDVKPSNLFLARRPDGTCAVKVLDFGISKLSVEGEGDEGNLTRSGAILGSPRYMSPEQVRDTKKVDERTDIWSLGVVLYELLTGASMYEVDTFPALCMAIVNDPPPPLRAKRPDAPAGLEAILLRCAEKDPKLRFTSAVELALSLAPFGPTEAALLAAHSARRFGLGTDPTLTAPTPPGAHPLSLASGDKLASAPATTRPVWPPIVRRPVAWASLLAVVGSVACGATFAWRFSRGDSQPPGPVTHVVDAIHPMPAHVAPPAESPHNASVVGSVVLPAPASTGASGAPSVTKIPAPPPARRPRPVARPASSPEDVNHAAVVNQH